MGMRGEIVFDKRVAMRWIGNHDRFCWLLSFDSFIARSRFVVAGGKNSGAYSGYNGGRLVNDREVLWFLSGHEF